MVFTAMIVTVMMMPIMIVVMVVIARVRVWYHSDDDCNRLYVVA